MLFFISINYINIYLVCMGACLGKEYNKNEVSSIHIDISGHNKGLESNKK
jgi:hypothetical protein